MRKNVSPTLIGVRAHPLVEHAAVNRVVVGSSPTRGVKIYKLLNSVDLFDRFTLFFIV